MGLQRLIIHLLLAGIAAYFVVLFLLYFNQAQFLYFPNNQNFMDCKGMEGYQKETYAHTRFYFKKQSGSDVVIFYHGNAGSACDRAFLGPLLESTNFSVVFVEYGGYSNDAISPSKKSILQDVHNIASFIDTEQFTNIVVLGESIGTGAASYHASLQPVSTVVLLSPFSTLSSLAQEKYPFFPIKLLLREEFSSDAWLSNHKGEVLIVHGTNDVIIPPHHSKKLFDSLSASDKERVLIQDAGHNDLYSFDATIALIKDYLK